jgi:hypothetical protein
MDYGVAITALATIAIGIFTWRLELSTDRLWEAGEKQRRLYEDTAERQLRAYIYVHPVSIYHLDPNSLICFLFSEINAGNTPAYKATQSGVILIENHPLRPNFPFPELPPPGPSRMSIGPGVKPEAIIRARQRFSHAEFVEIFHGHIRGKRLYIFGQANYIDAFKRERWTRFCYSFGGALDLIPLAQAGDWQTIANLVGAPGAPAFSFEIANQHNETDEG